MKAIEYKQTKSTLNHKIALLLREIADLLEQQNANIYRVNAYRHAAGTLEQLNISVKQIVEREGFNGLLALPNIGEGIGRSIYEYVATEHMSRLEGLRGGGDPEKLFRNVPGIGPRLAEQIHYKLHIETLEELELAILNGKFEELSGIGPRKSSAILASLEHILAKPKKVQFKTGNIPAVDILLKLDGEYRKAAAEGKLPLVTPKRFNPKNEAWLPIMHSTKDSWHFTVLFSNTARAHKLHKTSDWVVIYFYDQQHNESQCTVVTETHGPLLNKRVIRGRELECQAFYENI